jgi:hypothetical protein
MLTGGEISALLTSSVEIMGIFDAVDIACASAVEAQGIK